MLDSTLKWSQASLFFHDPPMILTSKSATHWYEGHMATDQVHEKGVFLWQDNNQWPARRPSWLSESHGAFY